jgi:hypothetical protein
VPGGLAVDQHGTAHLPHYRLMVSEPFIFKCPITDQNEFEGVTCPACTRLHFVNRKTGKLLGANGKGRV